MYIRNFKYSDEERVIGLGKRIFREADEIPLLQRALSLCVPELSFVAVEDKTIIGFTLVCAKVTNV